MQYPLKYLSILLWLGVCVPLTAQTEIVHVDSLPKVFLIGEHEDLYGDLYEEYHDILLSVCKDDMSLAFDRWMHLLVEMEEYAKSIEYDINGVKVWLKLFWNSSGAIDHISFFLKPESRNIDVSELSAFFSSFMNHYEMPIDTTVKFTHNGSASFPTAIIPPLSRR